MPTHLRVTNIGAATEGRDLRQLFEPHGGVRGAATYCDLDRTGVVGLVEMDSEQAGARAIAALNGKPFRGSRLSVAWAESDPPAPFTDAAAAPPAEPA